METHSNFKDFALLILRLVFGGAMLIGHGIGKFNRILNGETRFGDPLGMGQELSLYLATGAEALCAAFVILGLFTRLATLPLIFTMAVVVFVVKFGKEFGEIELPLLYLAGFFVILALGGGRYSLDSVRRKSW